MNSEDAHVVDEFDPLPIVEQCQAAIAHFDLDAMRSLVWDSFLTCTMVGEVFDIRARLDKFLSKNTGILTATPRLLGIEEREHENNARVELTTNGDPATRWEILLRDTTSTQGWRVARCRSTAP